MEIEINRQRSEVEIIGRKSGRPFGQSDVLNPSEIQRLLSFPDRRTKEGMRDYAVLLLLSNTPMRKGELINLKVGNMIDEGEQKYVAYSALKKKSGKPFWIKIPIHAKAYEGVLSYVKFDNKGKVRHDDPLLKTLGKHGPYEKRGITPAAVDCILRKYVKKAGIRKRVTPHSFRATYLTLRAHDHDAAALLKLSGHAGLGGLTPYLRASEEQKKAAALSFSFS